MDFNIHIFACDLINEVINEMINEIEKRDEVINEVEKSMLLFDKYLDKTGLDRKQYQYDGVKWCVKNEFATSLVFSPGGINHRSYFQIDRHYRIKLFDIF